MIPKDFDEMTVEEKREHCLDQVEAHRYELERHVMSGTLPTVVVAACSHVLAEVYHRRSVRAKAANVTRH